MATDPKSEALLDYLESFNRKERFFVVGDALGNRQFRLGDDFRRRLKATFSISVPKTTWTAMDYHLDWLHMALYLSENPGAEAKRQPNGGRVAGTKRTSTLSSQHVSAASHICGYSKRKP